MNRQQSVLRRETWRDHLLSSSGPVMLASGDGEIMHASDHRKRITIVRPFEDLVRLQLADVFEQLGLRIVRSFVPPVRLESVRSYLRSEGSSDRVVVPYEPREDGTGMELLIPLCKWTGSHRRFVVPVRGAAVLDVQRQLREALSGEACSRILVLTVDELLDVRVHDRLAGHLRVPGIPVAR